MVVGARLLHLRQLALEGAQMHIVQSFSLQSGKFKVKFLVGSVGAVVPPHFRQMHVECIDSLLALMQDYIVMDRGHKHSGGQSQICLWFANREAQPVACDDDPDSGNGDVDGAGASDGVPDETADAPHPPDPRASDDSDSDAPHASENHASHDDDFILPHGSDPHPPDPRALLTRARALLAERERKSREKDEHTLLTNDALSHPADAPYASVPLASHDGGKGKGKGWWR